MAKEDLGKVIGKQGRLAGSIRTILEAAGKKLGKRVHGDYRVACKMGSELLAENYPAFFHMRDIENHWVIARRFQLIDCYC